MSRNATAGRSAAAERALKGMVRPQAGRVENGVCEAGCAPVDVRLTLARLGRDDQRRRNDGTVGAVVACSREGSAALSLVSDGSVTARPVAGARAATLVVALIVVRRSRLIEVRPVSGPAVAVARALAATRRPRELDPRLAIAVNAEHEGSLGEGRDDLRQQRYKDGSGSDHERPFSLPPAAS